MLQTKVSGGALVRLIWQVQGGGTMINVLGAFAGTGPAITQATANSLGTAIKGALATSTFATSLHPTTILESVGVRDIRDINLPEFIDTGAAAAGSGTGDALPRSSALVVSLRTAHAGRGYRGRIYLGGFTETANDPDGTAAITTVNSAATFINAVKDAMTANGLPLAVVGRNRNAKSVVTTTTNPDGSTNVKTRSSPASAGHVDVVTGIQVRNDIWDSQRRRTSAGSASTLFLRPLVSIDV